MTKKYRIDSSYWAVETRYSTLKEARAALRRFNGGRLYGKFEVPEAAGWAEGWNLGKQEGCDTAVIVQEEGNLERGRA